MSNVARIIKMVSNQYTIDLNNQQHLAIAMGKLRLGERPIVGDFVRIEFLENKWVIQEVLERKNNLIRPLIANVDQAFIVMSMHEPDFSNRLVDRLIFLVSIEEIEPIIIINKIDLASEEEVLKTQNEYKDFRYKTIVTGKDVYNDDEITALLKDKVTVLAGQSGVGKSSIINRIDARFELRTQEISKVLGRGKHTTRHNELFEIAGGWLADTPGFSSLDFSHVDKYVLAHSVPEFSSRFNDCRFRNCLHYNEPGCAVKKAVENGEILASRYEHYIECLELIEEDEMR